MNDKGGDNGAVSDVVELEALPKDSFSWHPCQVSLCSRGPGLILQYKDNYLEEIITDKGEILERIRVRSTPLQGDDCSSLRQGDHVLATKNPHVKSVFCDARVEEAVRVRHSKRIHCRCSFRIKWLHQSLEEALTVPASAIMKLATKSINLHPTISTFFSMLESSNDLDKLPYSMVVDTMNLEMDINVLLEKQIEEISNSMGVSQKKIHKDFVFGLEVDLKGQSHGWAIDASLKDSCVRIPLLNNLKGEIEQSMETKNKISPASVSSTKEEFKGSRLPLNPLAARAALASLRSNFPQSAELSVQSNMEKDDVNSEYNTAKLTYGSKCCSFSNIDLSSPKDDFSLKISATLEGKSPNFKNIARTLFPTSSTPNASSRARVNKMEKNKISEKKIIQPSGTRLTRAQIQRNSAMHESTQMGDIKETQSRSIKTRRISRSTVNGAQKTEFKEYSATFEANMKNECIEIDTSAQNIVAPQNCLSNNQKILASPIDGGTGICSAEDDKSLSRKGGMFIKVDFRKRASAEDAEKPSYPKRLTRAAAREETEKNNVLPKLKYRKNNFTESNEVDLFKGNVSAESKRVKIAPNCKESVVDSSQGMSKNSASSKKQETRFSSRLRFLPRTRSQRKA